MWLLEAKKTILTTAIRIATKGAFVPTNKIKLEREELNAVIRRSAELGTTAEALAFGALSDAISRVREDPFRAGVLQAVKDTGGDLPLWSDSAPFAYEGAP